MSTERQSKNITVESEELTSETMPIIDLNYQGLSRRSIAVIIDGSVIFGLAYVTGLNPLGTLMFMVYIGYFIIFEALYGKTIGKHLLGLRVITKDGEPIDSRTSIVRNVLRIVDVLPLFYLIGAILVTRSEKKQRLGDRVANTVVQKEVD